MSGLGKVAITGTTSFLGGTSTLGGTFSRGTMSVSAGAVVVFNVNAAASAVTNSGTLTMGTHTLTVSGNYTQRSTGTLNVQAAGNSPSQYGRIVASGVVRLGGALNITAPGIPAPRWQHIPVRFGRCDGRQHLLDGQSLGSNRIFLLTYTPTGVSLTILAVQYDNLYATL